MKKQKYIVEMSEQEYNKCKQIINEFGFVKDTPEVNKLYGKISDIDNEIFRITRKHSTAKTKSTGGYVIRFSILDLFDGEKDVGNYINNLIEDLQKLAELYEEKDKLYKEIDRLRNPNKDKEDALGKKFVDGVKNIFERVNANITVETGEQSGWLRLNVENNDKKAWDILSYIMEKISKTEMIRIQGNYRNCFNIAYAQNLDEEKVNKYLKLFSIIVNQAVTKYKNV